MTEQHDAPEGGSTASKRLDGTARLCRALYGRRERSSDYLGGSDARMLHDAADRLSVSMAARPLPGASQCTDDMAHAMARLDGYDRDPDMPGLQRWKDYWDAAVIAAPTPPAPSGLVGAVRAEAKRHVIELEQCSIFVESVPLKRSMTDAADFLRRIATLDATLSGQQGGAVPAGDLVAALDEVRDLFPNSDEGVGFTPFEDWKLRVWKLTRHVEQATVPAGILPNVEALAEALFLAENWTDHNCRWADLVLETGTPTQAIVQHFREKATRLRARLAEQPVVPAGTGDADRGGDLRPGIEKALEIVEAERETVSVSSSAYQRLWSVRNALRAALDGASGQGEG